MGTRSRNTGASTLGLIASILGIVVVLAMISGLQNVDRDYGDGLMGAVTTGQTLHH